MFIKANNAFIKYYKAYELEIKITDAKKKNNVDFIRFFFAIRYNRKAPEFLLLRPEIKRLGILLNIATYRWIFGKPKKSKAISL